MLYFMCFLDMKVFFFIIIVLRLLCGNTAIEFLMDYQITRIKWVTFCPKMWFFFVPSSIIKRLKSVYKYLGVIYWHFKSHKAMQIPVIWQWILPSHLIFVLANSSVYVTLNGLLAVLSGSFVNVALVFLCIMSFSG